MPYRRPAIAPPKEPHQIEKEFGAYGFITASKDPGWISPHLKELMDDGRFALHQFSSAVDSAKGLLMPDYKPEAVQAKKAEMILKARRATMSFLKKHVERYKSETIAVSNMILRMTEPDRPSDPMKAMLQEMRHREIRDNLKNTDPRHRRQAIAGSLERIQAVVGNPDPNNVSIDADVLNEMRREYAFRQDPSLIEQEKDAREIYRAVRDRAAEINATASKMLIFTKLDDPLPPQEHFEVFTPESEYERALAERRVQIWNRQQMKAAQDKEFEEKNAGINLQAGARAARTSGGVRRRL